MRNNHEPIKKFTLIADDKNIVKISPDNTLHPGGVLYKAMTYNNTIPGPGYCSQSRRYISDNGI